MCRVYLEGRCKATWKREIKLPWREAGPPNDLDDKVDSDHKVVNEEVSHWDTLRSVSWLTTCGGTHSLQKFAVIPRQVSYPRRMNF